MTKYLLGLLFLVTLFSELSITTIPLSLVLLIVTASIQKKEWVFIAAAFIGFVLDILLLRIVGTTAAFFLVGLFLIFLYDRKFETASMVFVVLASCVGAFIYAILFVSVDVIAIAISAALFAAVAFLASSILFGAQKHRSYELQESSL